MRVLALIKIPFGGFSRVAFCGRLDVDLSSEENAKVVYTVKHDRKS